MNSLFNILSKARELINAGKNEEALFLIDSGLTYFPRNFELQSMLNKLPPSTVDYTSKRDVQARNAAIRYFEILDNYMRRKPISALEIGSGQGSWIDTARTRYSLGSDNLIAVDGPWATKASPDLIPFIPININENPEYLDQISLPSRKTFDLGICVEVCEHLQTSATKKLIRLLAERCKVIIFGWALTGQFGQGHINCRTQDYWMSLFGMHDCCTYDIFRGELWSSKELPAWYVQNTFLILTPNCDSSYAIQDLLSEFSVPGKININQPHPLATSPGMQFSLPKEKIISTKYLNFLPNISLDKTRQETKSIFKI